SLRDIHKNMDEFDSTSASYPESLQEINRNTDDLENSLAPSCPRFRNSDLSTPLHEVPRSRNSDISTHLCEVHTKNTDDLENSLALLHSKSRNSDLSTPLREVSRSRNLDTSTPLREVHRNTDELDSVSAHSRPESRDLNTSASLCLINTFASPTLPPCFNDMDTIFQLTTWLCANPNVLQFANNNAIYSSMQTSLANGQHRAKSKLIVITTNEMLDPDDIEIFANKKISEGLEFLHM
ncbi:6284_t:CDS:2, partial [Rhizophagus irregularis]